MAYGKEYAPSADSGIDGRTAGRARRDGHVTSDDGRGHTYKLIRGPLL